MSLTLSKLSPAVLTMIIGHLVKSADLLALDLTCKSLANIILPCHLFYHTIAAPISKNRIWIYFIVNPRLSRYIRRLEISTSRNPRMRLTDAHVKQANDGYTMPTSNSTPFRWSHELFIQALREMVNLKSFIWRHKEIPVHYDMSDMPQDFINELSQETVLPEWAISIPQIRRASFFDTPVVDQLRDLVSVTLVSIHDALAPGGASSAVEFLKACDKLEYLNLHTMYQHLAAELVFSCRWPNLKALLLSTRMGLDDSSKENFQRFFEFHSNIICLKWRASFPKFCQPTVVFSPGCFPHLKALDADDYLVRSIITTPCSPPRRLKKIMDFPVDEELWKEPEISFQGIGSHTVKIISFAPSSLSQLTEFGRFFPNVECVDISKSILSHGVWDVETKRFRKPSIAELAEYTDKLSLFQNLRAVIGLQFFDGPLDDEDSLRRLSWVNEVLPHLEFCVDDSSPGINLIRQGNSHTCLLEATDPKPVLTHKSSSRYSTDFMIPEEYDGNIV